MIYCKFYRSYFRVGLNTYSRGVIYRLPFGRYHVIGADKQRTYAS